MMFKSFRDLVAVDLIRFDQFSRHLCGVDKTKFLDMGYRGKAPPCFRIGHGEPHWDRGTIEQWLLDEYTRQITPREGSYGRKAAPIIMPPTSKMKAKAKQEETTT